MKFTPSEPRPYSRRGVVQQGRWEIDLRGVLDNGLVVERERRVFPVSVSSGKIGKRQAIAQACEEWERWNRHGQVLRPGKKPTLLTTAGMTTGQSPTVQQFVGDYLKLCRSPNAGSRGANRQSTVHSKETIFRIHIVPAFGHMPLDMVNQREIDHYVLRKAGEGLSSTSIRLHLTYFHHLLTVAEIHGLMARAPKFRKPPPGESRVKALDPDEAERFLAATKQRLDEPEALLIELYLKTGMRASEGIALYPADFNLAAAQPTLRVSRTYVFEEYGATKGGKPRVIPISSELAGRVDALLAKRGLSPYSTAKHLCADPKTEMPLSRVQISKWVASIGRAANSRHVHPHMLRHTFGTNCARRGVPPLTIKEWMGHADLVTTMKYVHLFAPDHLKWAHLLTE